MAGGVQGARAGWAACKAGQKPHYREFFKTRRVRRGCSHNAQCLPPIFRPHCPHLAQAGSRNGREAGSAGAVDGAGAVLWIWSKPSLPPQTREGASPSTISYCWEEGSGVDSPESSHLRPRQLQQGVGTSRASLTPVHRAANCCLPAGLFAVPGTPLAHPHLRAFVHTLPGMLFLPKYSQLPPSPPSGPV